MIGPPSVKRVLRGAILRVMLWRLRRRSVPMELCDANGVTLIVAPHQDDCAFGCAGLILSRTSAGRSVHVVYLTDGAASHRGHPTVTPDALARMRADEARVACGILGVSNENIDFLNAPDGELPRLGAGAREGLVKALASIIVRIGALEVFVTAAADGSSEHAAANVIVREAVALAALPETRVVEYPIWSRWSPLLLRGQLDRAARVRRLLLGPEALRLKIAAIRAFRSQCLPFHPWVAPALPAGFVNVFENPEEFFFEY